MLDSFARLIPNGKSRAMNHAKKIMDLLQESTRLERKLVDISEQEEQLQKLIITGFRTIIRASVIQTPGDENIDENVKRESAKRNTHTNYEGEGEIEVCEMDEIEEPAKSEGSASPSRRNQR